MCVCIEMAKSGQQLMAFPCIQMRKFDSGGGGRADMCGLRRRRRKVEEGGFGLSVAVCIILCRGSIVTSAESKGWDVLFE